MADPAQPSLRRTVGQWWRDNIAHHGLAPTLSRFGQIVWEFLRESTPSRRRQRYGDVDYDWDHRVDTTSATVSWRDRLLGLFLSPYQATDPGLFQEMLATIEVDYSQFTFIDLGSGKGRTLLMASDYPFRRIVGVEFLCALNAIAEQNIRSYSGDSQKCFDIVSLCQDARQFAFPEEPTILYLFNPLPERGLAQVIANLEASLVQCPRPIYVLYHNPVWEHLLTRSAVFKKRSGTHQYSIFVADGHGSK